MNLLITTVCNRRCEYCFAAEYVERDATDLKVDQRFITIEQFVKAVDFFAASNERRVSMLGGEPTLHPRFVDFVRYILRRGMDVQVFTNGMMPKRACAELASKIVADHVSFTVNLNPPDSRTAREDELVGNFLDTLGGACTPGVNINKAGMDLGYLIDAIETNGMNRHVRIGISHPTRNQENNNLSLSDYRAVLSEVAAFTRQSAHKEISVGLDCGFPLCLFSDEELGLIVRNSPVGKQLFDCKPVIDIGVDGTAWACFPLQSLGAVPIERFTNGRELSRFFQAMVEQSNPDQPVGIFAECGDCIHLKRNLCRGGCRSFSVYSNHQQPSNRELIPSMS